MKSIKEKIIPILITAFFTILAAGCQAPGVKASGLMDISITPGEVTITTTGTIWLSATGIYSDGSMVDLTSQLAWTSTDSAIVMVSDIEGSKGFVTGGTTGTVTVFAASGTVSGSAEVTVEYHVTTPYVVDDTPEDSAVLISGGVTTAPLSMAVNTNWLYIQTCTAAEAAGDIFVFISDTPAESACPAPWSKAGTVYLDAGRTIYMAAESTNSWAGWFRLLDASRFSGTDISDGSSIFSGAIDLVSVFGAMPASIYVAVVAYGTHNGAALIPAAQTPATTNSDGNLDAAEILHISLPGLTVIP